MTDDSSEGSAGGRRRVVGVKDVARLAGVSPNTVSNVIHGTGRCGEQTKERVRWAIDQLGYRPNLAARNLRRGRTGVIALAVPELYVPYFAELATRIIDRAQAYDYTVIIEQTERDRDRELAIISGTVAHLVDGVILSPLESGARDLQRRRDTTPVVLLGERVTPGVADHVAVDNSAAARLATSHLIATGRRRIAAIGAQPVEPVTAGGLRLAGYQRALGEAGLPVAEELIVPAGTFFRADGAAAMEHLLDSGAEPDAVFCFNDLMALGAIRVLHDRGLRVPEDIAVVGFDDIEDGRYSYPRLTTIAPDKAAIADGALRLLLDRIDGDTTAAREIIAPVELKIRESSVRDRPST